MNNKKIFLAAVITSVFILSAFLITVTADTGSGEYDYVIRPYRESFAVFENRNQTPLFIFEEQKLDDLPAADQKSIRSGLHIRDAEELAERIEDYES